MNKHIKRSIMCAGMMFLAGVGLHRAYQGKRLTPRIRFTSSYTMHYMNEHTNIIFDLNDTLFTINKRKALSLLGFSNIMGYFLSGKRTTDLELKLFQLLDTIYPPEKQNSHDVVPTHKGKPMPVLMQAWMLGKLSSQELIDIVMAHIERLAHEGFFANKREERIITKAIMLLFDAQTRCDLYRPVKKAIKLVRQCKKLGHKVYLLSNMDNELINLLRAKYPEIFELFDGVIISADLGHMKPHKEIYEHLLATYHMDPSRTYFIDDEQENIAGAQRVGMQGIHFDNARYAQVSSQLHDCGVLHQPNVA